MSRSKRPPMKKAQKVGSLLKEMLSDQGLGEKLSRYQAWLIWDQLVGEQIARRARPLRLRQGVLEVQVDHPVWMQQLQMLKPKILEKLNAQIPNAGITDIYLRKGQPGREASQVKKKEEPGPPAWKKIELSPEEQQAIEDKLQDVTDPELKAEMRRVFTLQTQLDKGRSS